MQHKLNGYKRNLTIMNYMPGRSPNRWTVRPTNLQPGTGAPMNQPGSPTTPLGAEKPSPGGIPERVDPSRTLPMAGTDPKKKKSRKRNKNKTAKDLNGPEGPDFVYTNRPPRNKRIEDKPGLAFTTKDRVPSGDYPYRDGAPTFTQTERVGKISELPNKEQTLTGWEKSAQVMNNIRCHIQVIEAAFFGQLPSFATGERKVDANCDKTQERIFITFYNQIRTIYQDRFNLNSQFTNAFTLENVFIYFVDVHALHCEYVCLLQRGAYYRNLDTGMENLLLDNIGRVLNTDVFYNIRNDLAQALRMSYLPRSVVDSNYEIFQTYRLGQQVTAPSVMYTTPLFTNMLEQCSVANNQTDYDTAIEVYRQALDKLIDRVTLGRSAASSAEPGLMRIYRSVASNGSTVTTQCPMFNIGRGALSQPDISFLNSVFSRVAPHTNLCLLNDQKEGNSQSHHDVDLCDAYNNQLTVATATEAFPNIVSTNSQHQTPNPLQAVVYASERESEEVQYKSIAFQAEKFTGTGHLLYRTMPGIRWSRIYLVEVGRNSALAQNQDFTFLLRDNYTRVSSVTHPFIQDNYVTKIFQANGSANYTCINNVDGTSAAKWFVTLGDLMEKQYNYGIDLLA
jgi:hypothetical protein